MTRKEIFALILLLVVVSYGVYNYLGRTYISEKKNPDLLNTAVTIKGESKSKNNAVLIDSVFAYIKSLENKFNDYDPESWISKVNNLHGVPYQMDADAYEILCIADSLYKMTKGLFDISVKPLYDLWGFSEIIPDVSTGQTQTPPDSVEIKETLKRIGFSKIKYDKQWITIPEGMKISFGAIAKGYALDKASDYMKAHGFLSGNLDCISSISFFGRKLPQIVGIMHPRAKETGKEIIGSFKIKNGSISTSGDYQLYFDYEGRRYHHILNPQTGYPIGDVYSVTVTNSSAAWADGLSTALFLLKPQDAINKLQSYPGSNAVIIYEEDEQVVSLLSKGMKQMGWHTE